ncbi:hypothetical protein STENM327S_07685 [Streptomyces tendae]
MPTRTIRPRRRLRRAGALLAVVLPVAACSDGGGDAGGAGGAPRDGGTLLVGAEADPGCLDPQQTGQISAIDVTRSVVDSLTAQDPESGKIVPWLAKSFATSADGSAFTFVLRDGVTFSDGKPVDAAAVKATFDNLVKLPANGAPSYLIGYRGTTVTDAHTLTVRFATANAQFLQATSTVGLGILSPASFTASAADRCRGKFVGSGPYVLDHYTTNQEAVLKKRADYAWPSSLATHKGAARLDEVKFTFIPEAGARTGALSSGQVDVAKALQPTDEAQSKGNGFRVLSAPGPGLVPPLSLNHQGILADRKVHGPRHLRPSGPRRGPVARATALAIVIALGGGVILGLVAGFFGSWADAVIMRAVEVDDVRFAAPALAHPRHRARRGHRPDRRRHRGDQRRRVHPSHAGGGAARTGRTVCRGRDPLRGAMVAHPPRYILPSAFGPVLALAALDFGLVVLAVSSLGFLGYGEPPPAPEWGSLVADGRNYPATAWWLTTLPSLTVAVVVLAANRLSRVFEAEGGHR